MTKKDYIKIAGAFKTNIEGAVDNGHHGTGRQRVYVLANQIATVLREDNPRFDVERFLEACGVPREEWNL